MEIKLSTDLKSPIYQDALNIRYKVFVDEQDVPENMEIDEYEDISTYFVGYIDDQPVVTARCFPTDDNGWHVQRVATYKEYRKRGLAKELLEYIEQVAKQEDYDYLILGAQDQAQGFYLKLGYQVIGDQYMDAGIEHHDMKKSL
ncbi:acetyltransferase [Companilactobacillus sp. RD055328]|uniref:GNAT family N-acetyltransferase n=1 Tax=Companilactobacillus sp. RD055328 TaxID=2916634 RepID=UPI001FC7ED32|nr:GNAT family N-acetyltransferase [Companilactobacillus sp. RD055328]GKQ43191.1 acetyltransferase [Companilactobacillus sp. RD055328]